jgi:hypothetical protein
VRCMHDLARTIRNIVVGEKRYFGEYN